MRLLGIDYGAKNVGLALSDEMGEFSYPLSVLQNSANLVSEILSICEEKKVSEIVIGESKDFKQNENQIMLQIKKFVDELRSKTSIPIHLHPEFLTSMEAERLQGKNDMHDASAAALILKSYLDTRKSK